MCRINWGFYALFNHKNLDIIDLRQSCNEVTLRIATGADIYLNYFF